MSNWINHPLVLEGERVKLVPLHQDHFPELVAIAKRREIWEHLPIAGQEEKELVQTLGTALLKRAYGEQYPFTAIDKRTGNVFGSTRLFEIFPEHKKLEIGWTWYHPDYWGTGHNLECKLLLLTYCFETLRTNRVQLKTRDVNLRSQAAIRKIGAVQEGILRKDRVMPDGTVRDTVVFSILNDEWSRVKQHLQTIISTTYQAGGINKV